ncbi:hypothetical protein CPA55_01170 [Parasaccharibacter sp. TMW2.1885]|uniref:hypothetical protein n=1 Tax=unclassified Parasaccharibacter TaxID=2626400 RepID=UPI0032B85D53|nr:hypothetical protein [Parasaccharibacter sp. TMW2.1885]
MTFLCEQETPYYRPGQPVEIAPVYVTLASQESSYVTGRVWGITGGDGVPGWGKAGCLWRT